MSTTAQQPGWRLREVAPIEPGLVCVEIERMIEFYSGVLGLRLFSDAETSPAKSAQFGATPDGYRIVRLETALGQKLKLVQPKVAPARNPLPPWVFERQGIAYITFVVADLEEVVAQLRQHGVRIVSQGIVEIRERIFAIYTLDPEDNYVEFIESRASIPQRGEGEA